LSQRGIAWALHAALLGLTENNRFFQFYGRFSEDDFILSMFTKKLQALYWCDMSYGRNRCPLISRTPFNMCGLPGGNTDVIPAVLA